MESMDCLHPGAYRSSSPGGHGLPPSWHLMQLISQSPWIASILAPNVAHLMESMDCLHPGPYRSSSPGGHGLPPSWHLMQLNSQSPWIASILAPNAAHLLESMDCPISWTPCVTVLILPSPVIEPLTLTS